MSRCESSVPQGTSVCRGNIWRSLVGLLNCLQRDAKGWNGGESWWVAPRQCLAGYGRCHITKHLYRYRVVYPIEGCQFGDRYVVEGTGCVRYETVRNVRNVVSDVYEVLDVCIFKVVQEERTLTRCFLRIVGNYITHKFLLITNLTHFFMYLFISSVYMFQASQCSSSGNRLY